jgi:hypothetical protein
MATDYEALAKQFGGTAVTASKVNEPFRVDIGGVPLFAETAGANIKPPEGYKLLPMSLADSKPPGTFYDETTGAFFTPSTQASQVVQPQAKQAVDLDALAAQLGGRVEEAREPSTTATGLAGAATRGVALPAAGAMLGAAMGAPFAGVGAIPGAIAGAGAATLAGLVADPVVGAVNSLFGTKYTMPTDALEDLLTRVGVAQPRTAAERIVQTTAAGASGGAGGVALGKAVEAAAAGPVTREVGRMMASTPGFQTLTGGTAGAAGGIAKEAGAGPVGQIAATIGGALIPSIPAATRAVTQQVAKQIAPAGAGIRERTEPVTIEQLRLGYDAPIAPTTKESLQSIVATVGEKISPQQSATLRKVITQNPDSVELVKYRLSGTQAVPDNEAASAIKQGWKDGTIASIKAASDKDRQAMTKMLNIFKMGEKNEKFRTMKRPADILGDTVQARIDFLINSNKQAGKDLNKIVNTRLAGQQVDFDTSINQFLGDLAESRIKVIRDKNGVAKVDLDGSKIEGDTAAENLLNIVLKRFSKTDVPDAQRVHEAKQFIDTRVSYGKVNPANALTTQAENIVKSLRFNLNQALGDKFSEYKAANTKYADTKTALDAMQESAGTKINFDSENANKALGTAMRKLTSNYSTRANLIDALDLANSTSTKYGMKLDDDIVNQLIFANELDRMFGAAAQTSLKGEVASAQRTGVEIASDLATRGGAARRALELLAEKAEELRGINKENAVKAMEELLKRKAGQP